MADQIETEVIAKETTPIDEKSKINDRLLVFDKKISNIGTSIALILELIVAVLVFAACAAGIVSLFPAFADFISSGAWSGINHYLEQIMTIVVGIEFFKMLCKPSSENVLETIIFVTARHMILAELKPLDNLLYVIAIVILVLTKRYLNVSLQRNPQKGEGRKLFKKSGE